VPRASRLPPYESSGRFPFGQRQVGDRLRQFGGGGAIGLTHVVPFLVEDMLKENGGIYSKAADWQPHVVVDGNLITGQNPGSAQDGGRAVLQRLAADAAPSKEHQQSTAAVADGVAHHRA
jgi:putative cofactor-binding repeat protein